MQSLMKEKVPRWSTWLLYWGEKEEECGPQNWNTSFVHCHSGTIVCVFNIIIINNMWTNEILSYWEMRLAVRIVSCKTRISTSSLFLPVVFDGLILPFQPTTYSDTILNLILPRQISGKAVKYNNNVWGIIIK